MRGLTIEVKYFDSVENGQTTNDPTWVVGLDLDITDKDISELNPQLFGPKFLGLDYHLFTQHGIRMFGMINYAEVAGNGEKPDES
jgi:hypothetical protein